MPMLWLLQQRPRLMNCSARLTKREKKHAEKVYGDIREKTVTDIEILDKNAELDRLASLERGEKYVPAAVEKIVSYVTME